jgi:hypothetical protein
MFDITECFFIHESSTFKCTIIHAKFVNKYIALITSNNLLEYIVFSENETNRENVFQMSFRAAPSALRKAEQLLFSALAHFSIATPFYTNPIISIDPQRIERTESDFIHMRTHKHTYRFTVKEATYYYYVTVGGNTFHKCIELFIYKEGASTLSQVYSEPECTVDSMLHGNGGETVDMIKGTLQLCQLLFGVNEYMFRDASEIECSEKDMSKPIGKRITKPFSLTHLSIINKCKTWYEFHFHATIKDPSEQKKYKDSLAVLNEPMNFTCETIASDPYARLTDEQCVELEPYFSSTKTWIQFLRSVPKEKQCELLNWTHSYLDRLMKFQPRAHDWVMYVEPVKQLVYPFPKEPKKETPSKDVCDTEPVPKYMKPTLMIPFGFFKQHGGGRTGTRKKSRSKSSLVFRHNGRHYKI